MAPHPERMGMTLASTKHCSARVVILRLHFLPSGHRDGQRKLWDLPSNGGRHGCSGGKLDLWSQELSLLLRKCGPCPSRLGPECWAFVEKFGSLEEVQTKFGEDVRVTRIACLVKVKADKSTKVHLIVEMLRSGVNGLVTKRERFVKTRVADLASGALDLLEAWAGPSYGAWLMSLRTMEKPSSLQRLTSQTLSSLCRCWSMNGSILSSKERGQQLVRFPQRRVRAHLGSTFAGPAGGSRRETHTSNICSATWVTLVFG